MLSIWSAIIVGPLTFIFVLLPLIQKRKLTFSIRGFALSALEFYKWLSLIILKARGLTPKLATEARVVDGKAWEDFCDTLKAAGASMLAKGTPKDPFNQAEGYRYLSRLVRAGLENFVECCDPNQPVLTSIANGRRAAPIKLGSDNPDNLYESAVLLSHITYRVHGSRGTVSYLGFGTQSGQYGQAGGLKTVDYIEAKDLILNKKSTLIEEDSAFEIRNKEKDEEEEDEVEIILSENRPENCKNWLRLSKESPHAMLIVRQTFLDSARERPAKISIDIVQAQPLASTASDWSCERLEDGLNRAGAFVAGAPLLFVHWADGFRKHPNTLPLFNQQVSNSYGGDPNIRYYHSYWELKPNEALVITSKVPECPYWNFQLNNYWMESLDYRYHNVHINKHSAKSEPDGSVIVIVAHNNPNISKWQGNWISTAGHGLGTMTWRWVKPNVPDSDLVNFHPTCKVIQLN